MKIYSKKNIINRSRKNFANVNSVSMGGEIGKELKNNNYRKVENGDK